MATTPTPAGSTLKDQQPAPPVPRPPDNFPDAGAIRMLQRQHANSKNKNSLQALPRVFVEWVMEEEVQDPGADTFLQWPTRRAFIHDSVQIRIQIEDLVIKNGSNYKFTLRREGDDPGADPLLFVGTSQTDVDAFNGKPTKASKRSRTKTKKAGQVTTAKGETSIYWEAVDDDSRSFVVTTIKLPDIPADTETDSHRYVLDFAIRQDGKTAEATSPPIEVVRWWAAGKDNLGLTRLKADALEGLIDGENYFKACSDAIKATVAGDSIYVAGWSFNPFTLMTGGKGGPGEAANAANMDEATKKVVVRKLADAAKRGVDVFILLDAINADFHTPWVNAFLDELIPDKTARAKVQVRKAVHPAMTKVGIGKFSKKIQLSSYHEKYVVVKGSQHEALVGGIDFEPNRNSPYKHGWAHFHNDYYCFVCEHVFGWDPADTDEGQEALYQLFKSPLELWHDCGVKVKGKKAISGICADFVRRWNEAGTADLAQPAIDPEEADVAWNCQLVLTDHLKSGTAMGTTSGKHFGTWDAHRVAILQARHYIYIENQYCRSVPMREALSEALTKNPQLKVMIVVPFQTEETAKVGNRRFKDKWIVNPRAWDQEEIQMRGFLHGDYLQYEFLTKLMKQAPTRVAVVCIAGVANQYDGTAWVDTVSDIYPHAKTMVVDDTWAYIGSANANGRSFRLDGEIGYVIRDRAVVTTYRKALWKEHLDVDVETRDIRKFMDDTWKAKIIKGKAKPADCSQAELQNVHAVELTDPPKGQKYNGPGSFLVTIDDYL